MANLFNPLLAPPVVVALVGSAASYFFIIKKTRAEFARQTESTLALMQQKADTTKSSDRDAIQAEQRAEIQELQRKMKLCEAEKADLVAKLLVEKSNVLILEAKQQVRGR